MIESGALAMITAEPTGGVVWHASRGAITLRVGVEGRPAHVGQAHLGVNAFEQMVQIAEPLSDLAHELLARRTDYPLESEEARGSMLVVGGASGSGANFNVVPGAAWFSVDRRFNPEEDLDEEVARLTTTIDAGGGAHRCPGQHRHPPAAAVRRHERRPSRRRRACALRRGSSRASRRASSSAPVCSRRDGTPSSAFQPLRTAPGASTSPTAPTSTSTRPRCAAALRSTRCSPANPATNRPTRQSPGTRRRVTPPQYPFSKGKASTPFWGVERPS